MTNKQTIDGVSIDQLKRDDRLFHVAKNWRSCDRGWVKFIHDEGDGLVRVRHENGAVPTVKLSNLQMQAMTPEQELSEFYEELSTGGKLTKRALCHIKSLQAEIAALNKPAAQPQGGVERLRAELAERDALLRDAFTLARFTLPDAWHARYWDLSTSAEPKPRGEVVASAVFNDPLYNAESDARNASALLEEVLEWFDDGVGRSPAEFKLMRKIGSWLGRSAPRIDGDSDECDHSEANKIGCPECGEVFK